MAKLLQIITHLMLARGRFLSDRKGVAAVEFALVVPLMIVMYLGTVEMSGGIAINKKVSRVAGTVADLVTQQTAVTEDNLEDIMEIGEAVLFPYKTRKPDILVVGIDVHSSHPQGGKVAWSRRYDEGMMENGPSIGEDIFVPVDLRFDGSFLVQVTTDLDYQPIVAWLIGNTVGVVKDGVGVIEMQETYYLRPRIGNTIICTDCS